MLKTKIILEITLDMLKIVLKDYYEESMFYGICLVHRRVSTRKSLSMVILGPITVPKLRRTTMILLTVLSKI